MNKWELTKDWISYLKRSQIAELEADADTGKLRYRREPKVEDLYTFLANQTDFEKEDIINAIKMVLSKAGSTTPSLNAPQQNPQQRQQQKSAQAPTRLPQAERIKEDFVDNPGRALSEKEVELTFDMLLSSAGQSKSSSAGTAQQQSDKAQDLKRIKNHIRTQMTPDEIMGLWRNLKNA